MFDILGDAMQTDLSVLKTRLTEDRIALREDLQRATAAVGAADRELLGRVLSCDRAELWRQDGARTMAQWLSGQVGISNWKARRWIGAAYAIEHLAHVGTALESGALSLDKTVELTRFATPATEVKLIEWARRVSVARVRERADEEIRRSLDEVTSAHESRYVRWSWSLDGECLAFDGILPADQGVIFTEALDRLARTLPSSPQPEEGSAAALLVDGEILLEQKRADALVVLASCGSGDAKTLDRTELVLHASLENLSGDERGCSFGSQMLHPETARRLTCDARLQVVLQDGKGKPVGVGRATQITPHWLRRQVLHRDGGECSFLGCEMRRFLTPHHIQHWTREGPTDLDNLIMLCSFHHTLVHEHGWSVTLDDHARPVWFRPSGRRYEPGPAPPKEPRKPRTTNSYLVAEAAGYSRMFDLISR